MPPVVSCETCKYWVPVSVSPEHPHCGECHRHAPMPLVGDFSRDMNIVVNHPVTHFDHWCGEFVKK